MKNTELIMDNGKLRMENWEERLLVKVTKFRPRKSKVKDLTELKCSFVPMKDLNEKQIEFEPKEERSIGDVYKGYTYFQDNDVLLAKVTPCFQNRKAGVAKGLTNGIGFGSSEFFVFRPSENILPKFIYYFFMTEDFINNGVANMSGAVGLKRVSNDYIKNIKIPLPPLPEQRRIVSKLDALFAEIDASLALIDQNIEQAEALKLSVLDEEFSMDNEELKIKNEPLSSIVKIVGGGTPKTKINEYWGGDIIWLSPKDLPPIGVISSVSKSGKKITELGLQKSSAKLLPKGTVCYSSRASIGKIAIAEVELATNQGFTNFVCNEGVYNRYLAYVLKQSENDIVNLSNSTTFKEVSKTAFKNFKVPITDYKTQQKIVQKLDALFGEIDGVINDYQQKRANLEALKSSLLDQAFKGKL